MLQNNPAPKPLEDELRSLFDREGERVAKICRLIHTKSGLLSESPVCSDRDYVLDMARTIVSSLKRYESETQCSEPVDDEIFLGLVQNEGERVADISRQIYDDCALSANVDWCLLVDNARWVLSPYCAEESEAQANIVLGFPGIRLKEE